jgi:hypothetical protein
MTDLACPHHPDLPQARSVLARIIGGQLMAVTHYDKCKDYIPGQVDLFHWTMTIDQLREALDATGLPGSTPVVIATSSGKGSPLSGIDTGNYSPNSTWRGDFEDEPNEHTTTVIFLKPTG